MGSPSPMSSLIVAHSARSPPLSREVPGGADGLVIAQLSAMAAAITDAPAPGSSGGFANLSFRRKSRTCSMDAAQSPSNNPNTPAGGQPSASSSSLSPAPAPESSCVSPLTDNVDAHVPRRASHRGRSVSFDDQSAPGVAANAKMASASQGVLSGCVARVAPFTAAPESVAGMRVNVADYE